MSDPTPVPVVPVLEYSRSVGVVLASNEYVDNLLDSGATPEDIWPYFQSSERTIEYYAQWIGSKFSAQSLADECASCHLPDPGFALQARWTVSMVRPNREIGLTGAVEARVFTVHAICPHCASRWLTSDSRASGAITAAVTGAAVCAAILWFAVPHLKRSLGVPTPVHNTVAGTFSLLAILLLFFAAAKHIGRQSWIPLRLRWNLPHRIRFVELGDIFKREGDRLVLVPDWRA
jgi:hypothetical protein